MAPWPFGCQIAFEGVKEEGEVFCIGLKGFITLGNPRGKRQKWRTFNNLNKEEVQGERYKFLANWRNSGKG